LSIDPPHWVCPLRNAVYPPDVIGWADMVAWRVVYLQHVYVDRRSLDRQRTDLLSQSISRNHGCRFSSQAPSSPNPSPLALVMKGLCLCSLVVEMHPSRSSGSHSNLAIKSVASRDTSGKVGNRRELRQLRLVAIDNQSACGTVSIPHTKQDLHFLAGYMPLVVAGDSSAASLQIGRRTLTDADTNGG
jgi:hypothetical protein